MDLYSKRNGRVFPTILMNVCKSILWKSLSMIWCNEEKLSVSCTCCFIVRWSTFSQKILINIMSLFWKLFSISFFFDGSKPGFFSKGSVKQFEAWASLSCRRFIMAFIILIASISDLSNEGQCLRFFHGGSIQWYRKQVLRDKELY